MKSCLQCKSKKDRSAFSRNKSRKDGLQDYCTDCILKYNQTPNRFWTTLKQNAKRRNIQFDISQKDFVQSYISWSNNNGSCTYCEIPYELMIQEKWQRQLNSIQRWSIDRKDNTVGYTIDNIQFCCIICNKWKSDMPWLVFDETRVGIRKLWETIFSNSPVDRSTL